MLFAAMVSPLIAWMEIGTSCRLSSLFCAVTVISSIEAAWTAGEASDIRMMLDKARLN